ncbi:helix-turn-helix domain-containing protein [Litorisediminicola beolgyonensis]|uniref:Multiprotein-bridging factor 1 family protein n=1 Tax=Litorisediminicola beolgyonensis TaxID=1173614 RepID=A0ABW3ZMQ6_9RHOB
MTDWYGPDAATFGDRVVAAREAAGMSQETLAKRLGVRVKTLQGWEDDASEPRANRLQMMAGLLNVSMVWLLTGEGEGLSAPVDMVIEGQDAASLLADLRALQVDLHRMAEKAGQLEKRLRKTLPQSKESGA